MDLGVFLVPHRVSLAVSGGIAALGSVIAQAPSATESQAGVWVGVAGLLGMAASLIKEYFADQKNKRESDVRAALLAEKLHQHNERSKRNTRALRRLNNWVEIACAKHGEDLPPKPDVDLDDFDDSDVDIPVIRMQSSLPIPK
jgi:hypothetical protein